MLSCAEYAPGKCKSKLIPGLILMLWLNGCGLAQGGKFPALASTGLEQAAPNIYVEKGTDAASRSRLLYAVQRARAAIYRAYGGVQSAPLIYACSSEKCYESFGGSNSVAKVYGKRILLSPRGLDWHFLAHEWSHAEMASRLKGRAWKRMPQWFDEGVAVVISSAPEHSEMHWQFLIANRVPRPSRQALYCLKSNKQWIDAVHVYGDDGDEERLRAGLPEVRPLYTTAGHEVRPWLIHAGSAGLLRFIQRLNAGEDFAAAYAEQTAVPAGLVACMGAGRGR